MEFMSTSLFPGLRRALAGFILLAGAAAPLLAGPSLRVGLPAPSLAAAEWLHGTPVAEFATGQVYVVEFRRPPKTNTQVVVPAVAAVAQKFRGRATFISVSMPESDAERTQATAGLDMLARSQGAQLPYVVALDPTNRPLARAWLEAAGVTNLPAAFVVGQDGSLAWQGRPGRALEEAVNAALNPRRVAQPNRQPSPELALRQRVSALRREGKPREALAAIETATAGDPVLTRHALSMRLSLLFELDPAAAQAEARKLGEGAYRNDPPILSTLAGMLLTRREPENRTYALTLAERACEQTGFAESSMVSTLARVQSANDQPLKAVETLEALLKRVEISGGANSAQWQRIRTELANARKAARLPPLPPAPDPERGAFAPPK
jgi:hypothetical protein